MNLAEKKQQIAKRLKKDSPAESHNRAFDERVARIRMQRKATEKHERRHGKAEHVARSHRERNDVSDMISEYQRSTR